MAGKKHTPEQIGKKLREAEKLRAEGLTIGQAAKKLKLLEGGKSALSGAGERQNEKELKKKIRDLERTLGKKTHELELAGELLRGWE